MVRGLNRSQFAPLKGSGASPGPGRGYKFGPRDEAVLALAGPEGTKIRAPGKKSREKIPGAVADGGELPFGIQDGIPALKEMAPRAATRRRIAFDREHPDRFTGDVLEHPDVVAAGISDRTAAYHHLGWREAPEESMRGVANLGSHDEPEDDRMLDLPDRWEDIPVKRQQRILRSVARYGVSPDSARRSFGTQLDRAMAREGGRHHSFYEVRGTSSSGDLMPRSVLEQSAETLGEEFHVVAAANAITSPRSRFIQRTPGKPTRYPNAEAAELAIRLARDDITGQDYADDKSGVFPTTPALKANVARAIDVTHSLQGGALPRDVWSPGGGPGKGAGDKVRAYYNAWINPRLSQGQFFVSDVHSGGTGMAPHLSHDELAGYLSIPGVHAFHDKIARDTMAERGLTNVSRAQSAQWSQAKLETSREDHRADVEGMRGEG